MFFLLADRCSGAVAGAAVAAAAAGYEADESDPGLSFGFCDGRPSLNSMSLSFFNFRHKFFGFNS